MRHVHQTAHARERVVYPRQRGVTAIERRPAIGPLHDMPAQVVRQAEDGRGDGQRPARLERRQQALHAGERTAQLLRLAARIPGYAGGGFGGTVAAFHGGVARVGARGDQAI